MCVWFPLSSLFYISYLDEDILKEYCLNFENVIKFDELFIYGLDFFLELRVLRETF